MTIRRDIEALAGRGLVTRVHGGATAAGSSVDEPGFAAKSTLHTAAIRAIAAAAVQLLEPGASVALSAGRTTHAVASALIGIPRLTVVTSSLRVAEAGFTTPNLAGAETSRALVACARRVAVVADNSKWGVVGLSTIATSSDVDVVVSDGGLLPDARQILESSCGRVVLAA